jgi:hypothetical protein
MQQEDPHRQIRELRIVTPEAGAKGSVAPHPDKAEGTR